MRYCLYFVVKFFKKTLLHFTLYFVLGQAQINDFCIEHVLHRKRPSGKLSCAYINIYLCISVYCNGVLLNYAKFEQ